MQGGGFVLSFDALNEYWFSSPSQRKERKTLKRVGGGEIDLRLPWDEFSAFF